MRTPPRRSSNLGACSLRRICLSANPLHVRTRPHVATHSVRGTGGVCCPLWIAAMTKCWRLLMFYRDSIGAFAVAAALIVTTGSARAADEKYPNWKGRWEVVNAPGLGGQRVKFDPNKEFGPPQQAPLTAEYQK